MRGVPLAKLSMAAQANDSVSTGRGQSRQQKHRSEHRSWQAAVAAKCGSAQVTAETVVVALEDIEDYQASKRLSSRITTPKP
jgi:hypothetical protein